MSNLLRESFAIAKKEIKLALRFKFPFFSSSLIGPMIRIMPFLLVYWGFFSFTPEGSIGGVVTAENFIVFLILGMLADVFFYMGWSAFHKKFMMEKFWQTIEATLLAPIYRLSLIFGIGMSEFVSLFPSLVLFLAVSFVFFPISLINLGVVLVVLLMLFSISLSIGLIVGCAALFNENFMPIFEYIRIAFVFFSCFYYPITVLRIPWLGIYGEILPTIAFINPIYQANFLIKNIWLQGVIPFESLSYVLFFAIVSPIAAVYIFRRLFKALSIQGY